MDKVSVVIPTYNRFELMLRALNSVKNQSYKNIEIIIVNDCSEEYEYYEYNFGDLIDCKTEDNYIIYYYDSLILINLEKRSKNIFGFVNLSYVRNIGIKNSTGNFIAFLDDDDIWIREKIEIQINEMKEFRCKMSSTEAFNGINSIDLKLIKKVIRKTEKNYIPKIWDKKFLEKGNFFITSSVIVSKDILKKVNYFNEKFKPPSEDIDCWLRCIKETNSVFINIPLIEYDKNHGNGKKYLS